VRVFDVTGPLEFFDMARSMGAPYDVVVCSPDGAVGILDTLVAPGGEVLAITAAVSTARECASPAPVSSGPAGICSTGWQEPALGVSWNGDGV
jgi:hypothetical protein